MSGLADLLEPEPKTAAGFVLALEIEGADPALLPALLFVEGRPLDPIFLGCDRTAGGFIVDGPGVLERHGQICFNGQRVFVASADPNHPIVVADRPIPTHWSEVAAPCRLQIGGVKALLRWRPAPATPATAPSTSKPVVLGGSGTDDEVTRFDLQAPASPVALPAAPPSPSSPRSLPPSPSSSLSVAPLAPSIVVSGAPEPSLAPVVESAASRTTPTVPPASAERARKLRLASRVILVVAILCLVVVGIKRARARGSVAEQGASAPATDAASTNAPEVAPVPPELPPDPRASIVVHGTTPKAGGPNLKKGTPAPDAGGPSLERVAADAVRRGDLRTAAEAYERLAAEHPDNPAFAHAAKVLRQQQPLAPTP